MLLLSLLACEPEPTPEPLTVRETIELAPADFGGFDEWNGVAAGWAVDTTAGLALVAGVAYEMGSPSFDLTLDPDGARTAQAWDVDMPPAFTDAVATWPLLATLVTDAAGVRLLPVDFAVVLARGDPSGAAATSFWVAVDGAGWFQRTDSPGDELAADLVFVEVSGFGAGAEVLDPSYGLAVEEVAISF
ncbi:MAG: hypothetical protein V4850_32480 [Myxococcota bacterium]